jgi:predicted dehydrogenase
VNALSKRDDVRVKAVYDHDAERAQKRAEQVQASVAPDINTILNDREITSVVICSETNRHLELVERSAAAGKHLFVEKPLATSVDEAARIREAVDRAGVVFQTGFFQRTTPQAQFLKQEAAAGHLGTITRMRHSNAHNGSLGGWFDTEWRWIADKAQAGGGGFADLGAHSLDIILWVLRPVCGQPVRYSASLGHATDRYGDIDEFGAGLITFESGAVAILEASWVDPKLRSPIELFGTRGQIQVIDGKIRYFSELVEGADGGEWTGPLPAQLPGAFDLFFDKLEGKNVPLVSVEEAAEESRVMAELYQAAGQ